MGEGVRRTGEGSLPAKSMAPMRVKIEMEALHEPVGHNKAMGAQNVRQVLECASPLALSDAIQSGRGLPQSKTLARGSTIPSVRDPDARTPCKETLHEPALTPALSHPMGEGVR